MSWRTALAVGRPPAPSINPNPHSQPLEKNYASQSQQHDGERDVTMLRHGGIMACWHRRKSRDLTA